MRDPRVEAWPRSWSATRPGCKAGETCVIEGEVVAEPLVQAVYEEVLKAGGLPIVQLALSEQAPAFYKHANDEQLEWISPTAQWMVENVDVRIAIMADTNTRALSSVDPAKQTIVSKAAASR